MTDRLRDVPDERLAAQLETASGEAAAEELFRRYRQRVYLWCFNYAHDREEAVDLTQEVFVRVFRGAAGFAGRASFATWVYCVTRNHCLNRLETRGARWRRRLVPLTDQDRADEDAADESAREEACDEILRPLLVAAERVMSEEELQAFVLHYRENLTVNEVTRVLGCANATGARTLIQSARRKFRRLAARKETGRD